MTVLAVNDCLDSSLAVCDVPNRPNRLYVDCRQKKVDGRELVARGRNRTEGSKMFSVNIKQWTIDSRKYTEDSGQYTVEIILLSEITLHLSDSIYPILFQIGHFGDFLAY